MPWPKTGATHYHAQLGLPDKRRAIKGFLVCNDIISMNRQGHFFNPQNIKKNFYSRQDFLNLKPFLNDCNQICV